MDCRTARVLIDFDRPPCPEMEPADAEALRQHLADCPECGPFAAQERHVDDHLGRAMRDVPVPDDFKQRLLNRLSRERDAWWRRWLVRGGAAAAAVLIALAGAWYFWPMPTPDTDRIQAEARDKIGANKDQVTDYFQRQGLGYLSLPTQFKFENLKDYYVEEFQGRPIPVLRFERMEGANKVDQGIPVYAKVLVLSDRHFNLKNLKDNPRVQSGMPKVLVLEQAGDPHVVFVVIYNANELADFFNPAGL
jgi:hypothetical protein